MTSPGDAISQLAAKDKRIAELEAELADPEKVLQRWAEKKLTKTDWWCPKCQHYCYVTGRSQAVINDLEAEVERMRKHLLIPHMHNGNRKDCRPMLYGGGRESGERRRDTVNRDEAPPGIIGGSQTAADPAVQCMEPRCIRTDRHDIPFGCRILTEEESSEAAHLRWLREDARKERAP